jgi:hypothetical protein
MIAASWTPISRSRTLARASRRLAKFAQAINKTKPMVAIRSQRLDVSMNIMRGIERIRDLAAPLQ